MLLRQLPSRLDLGDQIYNKILLKIFKFQVGKAGAPFEYCGGKKLDVFCALSAHKNSHQWMYSQQNK